jgi:GTP-binding protein
VAENSYRAMAEADVVVMVTDGRTGVTLSDDEVVKALRRQSRPVIVAVNKIEDVKHEPDAYAFYQLGYKDVVFISALAGRNTGELLDLVVERIDWTDYPRATPEFAAWRYDEAHPEPPLAEAAAEGAGEEQLPEDLGDYPFAWAEESRPRFVPDDSWRDTPVELVFVGRQNVGKSSLTNALLKDNRALVSDIAGTTRDPLLCRFEHGGQEFTVLDTAGMKRISRLKEDVDYYSLIRAERGLKLSEVALLTIDAAVGVVEQDKRVASKIDEAGRAVVIVVNKADLLEPGPHQRRAYEEYLRGELAKLRWAEVVFTSAVTGNGLDGMLAAAARARANFHRRIDNESLRVVLEEAVTLNPPPVVKNRELRFFDFRQIGNCPPTFLIEVNDKLIMRQAYRRFLYNTIRKHFELAGTHIDIVYYTRRRKRGRRPGRRG